MRKKSFITVTDQFCGAGGSSLGAQGAGAEIRKLPPFRRGNLN